MPKRVERISVFFDAYHKASIEEARYLYVELVDQLVDLVNQHPKIGPFLKENPFPSKGAGIFLSFQKGVGDYYLDGSISTISQGRGDKLYYSTAEKRKILHQAILGLDGLPEGEDEWVEKVQFIDFMEEPYEEAARIVHEQQAQNQVVFQVTPSSLPESPGMWKRFTQFIGF